MIGRTIAILISIAFLSVAAVAVMGSLWRFVLVRPSGPGKSQSLVQRIGVMAPGPHDFAEQQARLVRLDLPFAVIFLAGSFLLLATAGFGGAWLLTFAIWCAGAVTRWLTRSAHTVKIRCGLVLLLIGDAMLVLGIRGGGAFPQALVYLATALVGALLLYRANELPLHFTPHDPRTSYRRSVRPADPPAPSYPPNYAMHYDTVPSVAPRRPLAEVTPISYARRNPLRVREDESAVVSPPYYASR